MGSNTAAVSERGCLLGEVGGGLGRALKRQDVAVGDVEMHGGGRMTRAGAGRPRTTAIEPRWAGTEYNGSRLHTAALTARGHDACETGSQV